MKEYFENKLFIGFVIVIGVLTFFVGINNRQEEVKTNETVERR